MKTSLVLMAMTALLLGTACGSKTKEADTVPAPVVSPEPTPAPVAEGPKNDLQACEGKAAKDSCSYTSDKGEFKGVCTRSETQSLHCLPKKSKKK